MTGGYPSSTSLKKHERDYVHGCVHEYDHVRDRTYNYGCGHARARVGARCRVREVLGQLLPNPSRTAHTIVYPSLLQCRPRPFSLVPSLIQKQLIRTSIQSAQVSQRDLRIQATPDVHISRAPRLR